MKRAVARIFFAVTIAAALLYAGDHVSWRFGFTSQGAQYRTVRVQPYLAVPQKNGRTQFMLEDPVDAKCSTSPFPQGGVSPCWYLRRHAEQRINL